MKIRKNTFKTVFDVIYTGCALAVLVAFFLPWQGDCSGFDFVRYSSDIAYLHYLAVLAFIMVGLVFVFFRYRYAQVAAAFLGFLNLVHVYLFRFGGAPEGMRYGWWITVVAYIAATVVSIGSLVLAPKWFAKKRG
ncbi:MAG: hypothetical protein GY771_10230 [bacterium]|nr:hypothetical protein [bacterium]